MATIFYLVDTASTGTVPGGFGGTKKKLSLTRGGAAVTVTDNTVATLAGDGSSGAVWGSATSQLLANQFPTAGLIFITEPLNAFTFSSTPTVNLRGLESSTMANYGPQAILYQLTAAGVATSLSWASNPAEWGTTQGALVVTLGAQSGSVAAGERLCVVAHHGATSGVATASGFTASGFYNGPTSAASGDSFVTFGETITEQSAVPEPPRHGFVNLQDPGVLMEKLGARWRRRWGSGLLVPEFA